MVHGYPLPVLALWTSFFLVLSSSTALAQEQQVLPEHEEGTGFAVVEPGTEVGTGQPIVEPGTEVGTGQPAAIPVPTIQYEPIPIGTPMPVLLPPEQTPRTDAGSAFPRPPASASAMDTPDDYGGSIDVAWERSPDDPDGGGLVTHYWIGYRAEPEACRPQAEAEAGEEAQQGEQPALEAEGAADGWQLLAPVEAGTTSLTFEEARRGCTYRFRVEAVVYRADLEGPSLLSLPVAPVLQRSSPVETALVEAVDDLLVQDDGRDPLPPAQAFVEDRGWDAGGVVVVSWKSSPDDDFMGGDGFLGYDLLISEDPEGFWTRAAEIGAGLIGVYLPEAEAGQPDYIYELEQLDLEKPYYIRVVAVSEVGHSASPVLGPVLAPAAWFDGSLAYVVVLGLILCSLVLYYILMARRGKKAFIRKIAGLEAIDEAIGRATEMGRPILFVPGISDMDNVQTLAGLTLLGHVSKTIAEYDTRIDVPCCRSLVMTAGREVVKQAYLEAGRPDSYDENCVHYLTDDQFGYVAGVNGICVRDKPATCFFQGGFYAESLILAETGNSIGAIQIAGTAMTAQLPFFVAACDYTLIGEELFAASAYLSGDPKQLGSLKGQDMGKLLAMIVVVLGALVASVGSVVSRFSAEGGAARFFNSVMQWLERIFA